MIGVYVSYLARSNRHTVTLIKGVYISGSAWTRSHVARLGRTFSLEKELAWSSADFQFPLRIN